MIATQAQPSSPLSTTARFKSDGITILNAGSGNTSGSGIAAYCARPILRDVFITNCAQYGMRTEYTDSSAGGDDTFTMEGFLENVRIDTVGMHGWWNNGPHDTVTIGMNIVDAGQAATNTYDAFYYDKQGTGRNVSCHAWNRYSSARHRFAVNLQPGAGHEFTGGCNFEGAYSANVCILTGGALFDSSTRYYAAWNGTNIYLGSVATQNIIRGKIDAPGGGRPASVGVLFGNNSGDWIAQNYIDLVCSEQEASNIYFSPHDGGNNKIRLLTWNTTTATFTGTPNALDDIDLMIQNSSGTIHVRNLEQQTQISIGANSSATWTFPFAFAANPIVVFSPVSPSGGFSGGIWISSLSTTAVSIYNNNGVSMQRDVLAKVAS